MIHFSQFKKSLRNAWHGAVLVFHTEQNFRVQVIVGLLVIIFALVFQVRWAELIILVLMIGAVLSLEMINSILERIVDTFKPRIHPVVRDIKDIMAATVLTTSIAAAIIGLIIFFPYFIALF
ncbi:diacylglycerol kinase [Patescibacteria group bacterium]|nr:diacylglycerol kinase [Patescibacteria group bacterium]MBU1705112.1 diacylglycerol kinase [Patescibacteria group bacterium]